MGKRKLHLDSEYRRRWELFELEDGTIEDSRLKNWRDVEWDKVVRITANVHGETYEVVKKGKKGFKGFMNFRTFGKIAQYDENKKYIGHKTAQEWLIGWTNGKKCFMKVIDFYTGNLVGEIEIPIEQVKGHIHPKLKL